MYFLKLFRLYELKEYLLKQIEKVEIKTASFLKQIKNGKFNQLIQANCSSQIMLTRLLYIYLTKKFIALPSSEVRWIKSVILYVFLKIFFIYELLILIDQGRSVRLLINNKHTVSRRKREIWRNYVLFKLFN